MTEAKRNPNPFIRAAQAAREAKEKKFEIPVISDKHDQVGTQSKPDGVTHVTKVMRKSQRGR